MTKGDVHVYIWVLDSWIYPVPVIAREKNNVLIPWDYEISDNQLSRYGEIFLGIQVTRPGTYFVYNIQYVLFCGEYISRDIIKMRIYMFMMQRRVSLCAAYNARKI